jgi:ATP adenylyltransferase
MNQIWSPWRMEYIQGNKPGGCIFCDKPREQRDEENLILLRGQHCFVLMNRYPYTNGHLMVAPYEHVDMPTKMSPEALGEMMTLVNACLETLKDAMHPDGFNIGMNLGASAGAGIKDHIHMHVVPRWIGDTNFMPVIGQTRVIVEALAASYQKLRPVLVGKCPQQAPSEHPAAPVSGENP